MKHLFPALLLLSVITAKAQSDPGARHMIIFKNHQEYYFTKIIDREMILVVMNSGDSIRGTIQKIRQDTIFVSDTSVVMDDIRDIDHLTSYHSVSGKIKYYSSARYEADTSIWEPVYLPEKVYEDPAEYSWVSRDVKKSLKRENWENNHDPLKYNNFLKFNLVRLLHLELSMSYERVIYGHFSLETEVSYMVGIKEGVMTTMIQQPYYNYKGFSVQEAGKFYFNSICYLSPTILYRYGWFEDVQTYWPNEAHGGVLEDQYRNDYGGSIRFGFMKRFNRFVADFYFGAGLKYIVLFTRTYGFYYEMYSDDYHPYDLPVTENYYLWGPVINAGIRIGMGF